jgi:hypothetical protein
MVTKHEIGRHHLRDAGDRNRVLIRAGVDLRMSGLDECGLAVCRPHRAGDRFDLCTTVRMAEDAEG